MAIPPWTPWYKRPLLWAKALVERPKEVEAGPQFVAALSATPAFDPDRARSAYAAFALVYACVNQKAADLAGLPIRVSADKRGREVIDDHPFYTLMERPNPGTSGELFRRQILVDWFTSGLAAAQATYGGRLDEPMALVNLMPGDFEIVPADQGYPDGVRLTYGRSSDVIALSAMVLLRSAGWTTGADVLAGTAPIQPLNDSLSALQAARRFSAASAAKGRPDIVVGPSMNATSVAAGQPVAMSESAINDLRERFEQQVRDGGVVINARGLDIKPLSWSPRDMEFQALDQVTREEILAVMDVPPHRVGLPVANYAQSREQDIKYWEGRQADARVIDAELTRIARQFSTEHPQVFVRHDFSAISALQRSRSERLERVHSWVMLGADPMRAAEYEGFEDSPLTPLAQPTDTADDAGEDKATPAPKQRTVLPEDGDQEEVRAVLWKAWLKGHEAGEQRVQSRVQLYLRQQAQRIAGRLESVGIKSAGHLRALNGTLEDVIQELEEQRLLKDALLTLLRDLAELGAEEAAQQLLDEELELATLDEAVARLASEVSATISRTTAEHIAEIITDGLVEGLTVGDLQEQILRDSMFSAARALRIARTETTHVLAVGQQQAYTRIRSMGVEFKVQWLSARDEHVRESHRALDGQTVDVGSPFVDPSTSDSAPGPGQWSHAHLNVNCRCTTIAVKGAA